MKAAASLFQSAILLFQKVASKHHQVFRDEKAHLLMVTYRAFTLRNELVEEI